MTKKQTTNKVLHVKKSSAKKQNKVSPQDPVQKFFSVVVTIIGVIGLAIGLLILILFCVE